MAPGDRRQAPQRCPSADSEGGRRWKGQETPIPCLVALHSRQQAEQPATQATRTACPVCSHSARAPGQGPLRAASIAGSSCSQDGRQPWAEAGRGQPGEPRPWSPEQSCLGGRGLDFRWKGAREQYRAREEWWEANKVTPRVMRGVSGPQTKETKPE